jgi:hypothetical protein
MDKDFSFRFFFVSSFRLSVAVTNFTFVKLSEAVLHLQSFQLQFAFVTLSEVETRSNKNIPNKKKSVLNPRLRDSESVSSACQN